ncbi:MAG: oxygen-independent coproporphyrinogen III oxidase [Rhizobiaceae bacterium]|nr:oxygen-independent coproporphyrinogen III oxidase [Rhizobiaceae bacterium]
MNRLPRKLPQLPRYTSYPTAPHFNRHSAKEAQSILFSSVDNENPVSVYIHIPFCDRLCWFCGCHTKHTLKYEPIKIYVDTLIEEINQFSSRIGIKPKIASLHFGGGSPSMLKPVEAKLLSEVLEKVFRFLPSTEVSVEVDPNDTSEEMIEALACLGMTRASLGVQDFNPIVQDAINRPQSFEDTWELVERLREAGISSLNIDALYGLPFQTKNSIKKTIRQILSMDPDRIALFGYAHVPSIKKHQNLIDVRNLPEDAERIEQSLAARAEILNAGYEAVGIDHFAKKADALAISKRNLTLRRNFQGYTTDRADLLLGFGASSISSSDKAYVQNTVATGNYMRLVTDKKSVAERGFVLSSDDQIRAYMIEKLMCNFQIDPIDLLKNMAPKQLRMSRKWRGLPRTTNMACVNFTMACCEYYLADKIM